MSLEATKPLFIEENRQQRTAYILRDVAYRIYAEMEFIPLERRSEKERNECKDRKAETPTKYIKIFLRRAHKGQCFTQPYLGCREFSCSFKYVPQGREQDLPIDESRDLGIMLFDMDFEKNLQCPPPLFFHAQMEHGVIEVPHKSSKEILR
jgi:CRISPR-associated protein cas5, dvulg subtype